MSSNTITSLWRRLSRAKQYREGERLSISSFSQIPFKNSYYKVGQMFNLRLYHVNNTPYQTTSDIYTNDLSKLQAQINYLNSHLFIKRVLLVFAVISGYFLFVFEEPSKDWGDKFDVKFNVKAYGSLEDSSGEGNTEIDD